jgi:nucleoside-diphosphate-sugar epimerase
MARVLVTGATGFIGRHLVPLLTARGDRVCCLVRRPAADSLFPNLDIEYRRGDVTDAASLTDAVRGVEVVYHVAGATLVRSSAEYHRVNADGTRHVAEACAAQPNPPKIVYVSSLAAAGPSAPDRPHTEADPPAPVSKYGRSKLAAEDALRAVADRVPTTVLRPPSVTGPGDPHNLVLFRAARRGLVAAPGSTARRLAWIDVRDLARALVLAADRGEALGPTAGQGVYYTALPETTTYAELGRLAGATVGQSRVWAVPLPWVTCRTAGAFNDLIGRLTGRPRLLTTDKLRDGLAGSWTCSSAKAARDLGFTCDISLAESFRQMADWYRARGLL